LPENPLLPHRKLRELHALMLRARDLERKHARDRKSTTAREALLAATAMQLLPGDLLSARQDDLTAAQLAPQSTRSHPGRQPRTSTIPPIAEFPSRLALCAAAAKGLQATGADAVLLSFTQAGASEPGWQAALAWAHAAQLPLILACADPMFDRPAGKSSPASLTFPAISRLARRIKLPILTVDGEDAVAVYRVMQESVLRARTGGGPAIIWAILSPPATASRKLPRAAQPVARLGSYLAARNISLPR
jgi:hypothetical protein